MAKIAAAAGVTRQSAYLHFGNRAGLLLALVRWIDERSRFFERFERAARSGAPLEVLEAYVTTWLGYLPSLHPVPGYLARAKDDPAAREAWADRMQALEASYRTPIRALHRAHRLCRGLSVERAVELVRGVASIHAWEHLVHDCGWDQRRAERSLWRAVCGALLRDEDDPPPSSRQAPR